MNITADAVKQLRERTGAGMMECKKALVEAAGDLDAAAEAMRKSGLAKADKKASRVAAEGTIVVEVVLEVVVGGTVVVVVEVVVVELEDVVEGTITMQRAIAAGLSARVEYRVDRSTMAFFPNEDGTARRWQQTVGVSLFYGWSSR